MIVKRNNNSSPRSIVQTKHCFSLLESIARYRGYLFSSGNIEESINKKTLRRLFSLTTKRRNSAVLRVGSSTLTFATQVSEQGHSVRYFHCVLLILSARTSSLSRDSCLQWKYLLPLYNSAGRHICQRAIILISSASTLGPRGILTLLNELIFQV